MVVKHLAEGSVKPTLKENVIYLFSMRFCPYAHRAHLILNAKNVHCGVHKWFCGPPQDYPNSFVDCGGSPNGIVEIKAPQIQIMKIVELSRTDLMGVFSWHTSVNEYEIIYINLSSKPKWYLELFPAGRVPALLYKGNFLYESVLLADFLNEEFPQNSLHNTDPIKKFKDKLLVENFGKVGSAFYKIAMVEFSSENFEDLLKSIDEFETEKVNRGTTYFGGNEKPLMVDYLIWPWFERIGALAVLYGDEAKFSAQRFPNLVKWISLMEKDKYVQTHYLTPQQFAKHFTLRKQNDPGAFDNII